MAENVALLQLQESSVQQVKIGTADGTSGYSDEDISGLDEDRLGYVDCTIDQSNRSLREIVHPLTNFDIVLAVPDQSLHGFGITTVFVTITTGIGDVLSGSGIVIVTGELLYEVSSLRQHLVRNVIVQLIGVKGRDLSVDKAGLYVCSRMQTHCM